MARKPTTQYVALRCLAVLFLVTLSLVLLPARGAPATRRPCTTDTSRDSQPAEAAPSPRNAVQVWGGLSAGSIRVWGKIPDTRFQAVGVRYHRRLLQGDAYAVDYTVAVLPVATMTYEPVLGAPRVAQLRGEHTLRGLGVTPLGIRLRARTGTRWQPYVESAGGFVRFGEPLPDRRGERFNFTFQLGVGVQVSTGQGTALTLGYRFHHLSNGFRGAINPGFDSNLFYLSVTLLQF